MSTNSSDTVSSTREGIVAGKWVHLLFDSGTQVVQWKGAGKYYRIGSLAADDVGEHGRYEVGEELCTWLNGGAEPWWLDMLNHIAADTVRTPHGCVIRATGPMIDTATPPSWGCWREDQSLEAMLGRELMASTLLRRDRDGAREASA